MPHPHHPPPKESHLRRRPRGITEAVGWQSGGGFRYYRLAPSLLEKDRWGNWVITREYNPAMLAEAMCKHMGFTYAPSQDPAEYWRHGHSSERDFIFVATTNLTHAQLKAISLDVGPERTLLICCRAFHTRADSFENLTVRKIPQVGDDPGRRRLLTRATARRSAGWSVACSARAPGRARLHGLSPS